MQSRPAFTRSPYPSSHCSRPWAVGPPTSFSPIRRRFLSAGGGSVSCQGHIRPPNRSLPDSISVPSPPAPASSCAYHPSLSSSNSLRRASASSLFRLASLELPIPLPPNVYPPCDGRGDGDGDSSGGYGGGGDGAMKGSESRAGAVKLLTETPMTPRRRDAGGDGGGGEGGGEGGGGEGGGDGGGGDGGGGDGGGGEGPSNATASTSEVTL